MPGMLLDVDGFSILFINSIQNSSLSDHSFQENTPNKQKK